MRPWIVLGIPLAVACTLFPKAAAACTAPTCSRAYAAPAEGKTLTLSAPALFFQEPHGHLSDDAGTATPSLWSGGQEVPLTTSAEGSWGHLLVPSSPLVAGTVYELRYEETCSSSKLGPVVQAFTAGPQAAAPVALGTLTVKATSQEQVSVATSNGSCTQKLIAGVVDLNLEFDESIKPYLATTKLTTMVGTQQWATTPYGIDPIILTGHPQEYAAHRYDRIFGACPGQGFFQDHGVGLGTIHVTITAHIAGAQTDPPPAALDVELSCPQGAGGNAGAGGGAGAAPGNDASVLPTDGGNPSLLPAEAEGDGCGCRSASQRDASAWTLTLLALAACAKSRRSGTARTRRPKG